MRFTYSKRKKAKLFANSGDPDQTPHSAASDLGLHCLPFTLLRVSRLQRVNPCRPIQKPLQTVQIQMRQLETRIYTVCHFVIDI